MTGASSSATSRRGPASSSALGSARSPTTSAPDAQARASTVVAIAAATGTRNAGRCWAIVLELVVAQEGVHAHDGVHAVTHRPHADRLADARHALLAQEQLGGVSAGVVHRHPHDNSRAHALCGIGMRVEGVPRPEDPRRRPIGADPATARRSIDGEQGRSKSASARAHRARLGREAEAILVDTRQSSRSAFPPAAITSLVSRAKRSFPRRIPGVRFGPSLRLSCRPPSRHFAYQCSRPPASTRTKSEPVP